MTDEERREQAKPEQYVKSRLDKILKELYDLDPSIASELARATSTMEEEAQHISDQALLSGESLSPVERYEMKMALDHPPFDVPIPIPDRFELKPEPARDFYDALHKTYNEVAAKLGPDEQLVILYYDPAGNKTRVHAFSYQKPELLVLHGEGRTIIANVHSLQLTMGVEKIEPGAKRDIGFLTTL